ncbi:MAG: C1 family peptidase [Candidatus Wallbacteria bacterium]|nr:C1 family peptidase [Candidatus Wallbacteria bacterium]
MKKVLVLISIIFYSNFLLAASLEGISENRMLRFSQACRIAASEGATYTLSLDAMPEGVNYEDWCGLSSLENLPDAGRINVSNSARDLPEKFDWRDKNAVSQVKNQGGSMTCWAFALTGVFESVIMMKTHTQVILSEQDLVNCNQYGYSCQGGKLDAGKYFQDIGAALSKDCPYVGQDTACNNALSRPYKITSWSFLGQTPSVEEIKQAIMSSGPVACAVTIDNNFGLYSGGVYNHDAQGPVNHGVILVGWFDRMGNGCWILKNSGGAQWGVKGFMYIEYGKSHVGTTPVVMTY